MTLEFELAPMDGPIKGVTAAMFLILPPMIVCAMLFTKFFLAPVALLAVVYAWIWLRFRPTRFEVSPDLLTIVWPLKTRQILRSAISNVEIIDRAELGDRVGWRVRIGAGGLWGGFGWLWTQKQGLIRMYISRTDRFVWFDADGWSWIVTPDRPDDFVSAVST